MRLAVVAVLISGTGAEADRAGICDRQRTACGMDGPGDDFGGIAKIGDREDVAMRARRISRPRVGDRECTRRASTMPI